MNTTDLPNLPVPPGASADDWNMVTEWGDHVRGLSWSTHDAAGIGISIDGEQFADGGPLRLQDQVRIQRPPL